MHTILGIFILINWIIAYFYMRRKLYGDMPDFLTLLGLSFCCAVLFMVGEFILTIILELIFGII